MCVKFTDQNFQEEVKNSQIPVLVDFWAPWCGPCQMMGPIIEELAKEFEGKVKVGKFNVDENSSIASEYEILSIPTIKIFKGGVVSEEMTGLQPKEILAEKINAVIKNN